MAEDKENDEDKKPLSLVERMKLKTQTQPKYGGEYVAKSASVSVNDCPNCGAGRAKREGVKACAYCGFVFLEKDHTAGIHLNREKGRGE